MDDTLTSREKMAIIEYIFTSIDLSHYRYEVLQYTNDLEKLLTQKYYVSANFLGLNCLMIFTKLRNQTYSVIIDRKTLSYNISKIDYSKVNMFKIRVNLDLSIYLGTIFDGMFFRAKNVKSFIIMDVYQFRGQDVSNSYINTKLMSILSYLQNTYDNADPQNNIVLNVNKLYDIDKTEKLMTNIIPSLQSDNIKGICFYPEISATKLIFLFDNKSENKNEKISSKQKEELIKQQITNDSKFIPKGNIDQNSYVFELRKTEYADVYELNIAQPIENNKLKRVKVDIAYISNITRSKWCNDIFKNSNTNNINVICKYYPDKIKWEPIAISNVKYPSKVDEFDII